MQKKTKKILLWVLGVYLGLGLIGILCEFLPKKSAKEKATEKTQAVAAPAAEQKPTVQYLRPGVSNDVKVRNALIRNYDGGYRSDTPFGWRQIVSLAADEWKSVTGAFSDIKRQFSAIARKRSAFSPSHPAAFASQASAYMMIYFRSPSSIISRAR